MTRQFRLGLIVPSSNVTMETELPELFRRREQTAPERFTFHSARMRMTKVTPEALAAMNGVSDRSALELTDADCDAIAYACLVAVMVSGPGAHMEVESRLGRIASEERPVPVITSAGALGAGIRAVGARRVALIAPYVPALTACVVDYLSAQGIDVVDNISLGVADNREVGRLDPSRLVGLAAQLDLTRAEAIVVSACVQMPSLPAIAEIEARTGLPALSAATATTRMLLDALGLDPTIEGAGALLSGARVSSG